MPKSKAIGLAVRVVRCFPDRRTGLEVSETRLSELWRALPGDPVPPEPVGLALAGARVLVAAAPLAEPFAQRLRVRGPIRCSRTQVSTA